MRIISGTCKGRRIYAPKGDTTRPALDQVKEAVFNILFDVRDSEVLDLFAGSGSMGLEALSRGARHAVFVERDRRVVETLNRNIELCGMGAEATVIVSAVDAALVKLARRGARFDLVFVDPPYLKDLVVTTLGALARTPLIDERSIIVVEHHPKEPITEIPGIALTDQRKYGQTLISFLKKSDSSKPKV